MINKHIVKAGDLSNVGFLVAIIATVAILGLAVMNLSNEGHQEAPLITRVENGGILELDALPESVELPNGAVVKDISIGVAEIYYVWEAVPRMVKRGDQEKIVYVSVQRETFPGDPNADGIIYGNQEMISGKVATVSEDQSQYLKLTWLDNQQQKIGHTYARIDAATEISRTIFWALPGSEKVQIEIV